MRQLQILPGQGLVVQLQEAGDEVRPAWSGLWVIHPATLDNLPQLPWTMSRTTHPVAFLDQLQQSVQCGNISVGSVAPRDYLPQQNTKGPDIGLNDKFEVRHFTYTYNI